MNYCVVEFKINRTLKPNQTLLISGTQDQFGAWNLDEAIQCIKEKRGSYSYYKSEIPVYAYRSKHPVTFQTLIQAVFIVFFDFFNV